ncbi:hypothetical protein ABZS68_16550 [Streptomyces sp. NPDC005571]|uniref:hypothetical protein n=1 Tax=Streptomyces sp. NPDC005571 TaxID=3156888 RepID=UPI0033B05CD7
MSDRAGRDSRTVAGAANAPREQGHRHISCGRRTPTKTRENAISSVGGTVTRP